MKIERNKLGILIDTDGQIPYQYGHSIAKYNEMYNDNKFMFKRVFKSEENTINSFGIELIKYLR